MSEAQTSGADRVSLETGVSANAETAPQSETKPAKRKRGRPKGSKNRKVKHTEGVKYGDPEFKNRPGERQLTPEELMLLCAEWQRTQRVEKAAKVVGISTAQAEDIVVKYIKNHPDVLGDPDLVLRSGVLMGELQALAIERAKDNMADIYGKTAVMTAWIAGQKRDAYYKSWKDIMGASATEDPEKLKAKLEAVNNELKQYGSGSEVAQGQSALAGATTESGAEETLGADGGPGGDERS